MSLFSVQDSIIRPQTITIVWYYETGAANVIKRTCESTSETSQGFRAV
jgi:hypothetical protein